jgi:hypothetical protein
MPRETGPRWIAYDDRPAYRRGRLSLKSRAECREGRVERWASGACGSRGAFQQIWTWFFARSRRSAHYERQADGAINRRRDPLQDVLDKLDGVSCQLGLVD